MKKIVCVLLSVFIFFGLFAQSIPSTGLTDSDVKNFAKNLTKIQAELDKIDVQISGDAGLSDLDSIIEAVEILERFGVSGENACEKINMICFCYYVITIDKTMDELDEESKALLKSLGQDPAATYRALINDKDCKIVEKNYDAVLKAIESLN